MEVPVEQRTPAEVLDTISDQDVAFVDFRFSDLPGVMQHVTIPAEALTEGHFETGHPFDGSSVRGFQEIQESDMILVPDPDTGYLDPFRPHPTYVLHCFVADPVTGESYSRDPRHIARKAEQHLYSTGLADTAYFGPEPEFFVFDDVRFETRSNGAFYSVDSDEGQWNTGRDEQPNLGYKPRTKQGYFPVPPMDHLHDLRSQMALNLEQVGVPVELHHHEVASGGQGEIGIRFDTLLAMADKLMTFKYVLKSTAWEAGKSLTFMPKPVFEDNGSGMHTHQSLWKGGEPLFYEEGGYAGLSDLARWYIGGLLHHAPALLAFTNPTTNSFKRLVPGYEAPVNLVYSQRNRSASCRIPLANLSPKAKRVEFRCPDNTANPYLAFSAMLLAGLDGIDKRIEPPDPVDKDLYDLPPEELADVPQVPASLEAALDALEADSDFLRAGDVFTDDLLETWIAYKRVNEVDALRLRPHPYEFTLYYDI
ncbi:type I glutamate--ammonia ligase [Iamia majanohamensis]|uniref:Glutamine synthetase n=1 Tax=Iamia majanohamensis TaxID=467976 RepID=A0AAE9Y8R1_9ACTN|nr:type I glutamate--ammonia ligase [Iamia majanohamensis]WCO66558.1 type I glutamate--ammonia ligase [Iamia majanohamensis]